MVIVFCQNLRNYALKLYFRQLMVHRSQHPHFQDFEEKKEKIRNNNMYYLQDFFLTKFFI